ncbi:hemolysin-III related [Candidatus Izimaplasma bacterium HR1]|jgi:hemolysin III|uniref:PAQR family membrane homeostasis protein TrhA n=1 Tax=Candidatus Izimoplasma sp. HR1 TaxID=1541959 RepID=UPI0004F5C9A5|nr:hemolysin-III related [Candidatus Izimaplasma bacterium HR1]
MKKTSLGELIANAISHGVGVIFAITALVILIIKSDTTPEILSSIVFGLSLIMLYLSSTLFHSFPEKMTRVFTVFQRLDHSSIFLLISGTYTPFLILVVDNLTGYILLGILWAITIVGIVFKAIWIDKFKYVHLSIYLLMGWSIIFVYNDVIDGIGDCFLYLLLGGISYTLGVAFYVSRFKYAHFVWHLFVLGGSVFHFVCVLMILS